MKIIIEVEGLSGPPMTEDESDKRVKLVIYDGKRWRSVLYRAKLIGLSFEASSFKSWLDKHTPNHTLEFKGPMSWNDLQKALDKIDEYEDFKEKQHKRK